MYIIKEIQNKVGKWALSKKSKKFTFSTFAGGEEKCTSDCGPRSSNDNDLAVVFDGPTSLISFLTAALMGDDDVDILRTISLPSDDTMRVLHVSIASTV